MEDVEAGAGAAAVALGTAGARAIVEEVIALVIALQGAVVLRQLVDAATAGHHSSTARNMHPPCYW